MSQQQPVVSFELVGGVGHTTDYKNVVDARIKDPEGLRRMCNTMVATPECATNERAVYALAGLRLLDDPNFGAALDSVAKRPGTFLYAGVGVKAPETKDMAYVRFVFERFYKSSDDLTMPPGVERPKRIDYSSPAANNSKPSRTRKPVLSPTTTMSQMLCRIRHSIVTLRVHPIRRTAIQRASSAVALSSCNSFM